MKKNEVNEKKCDSETHKVKQSMSYFVIFNLYLDRGQTKWRVIEELMFLDSHTT